MPNARENSFAVSRRSGESANGTKAAAYTFHRVAEKKATLKNVAADPAGDAGDFR